MRRTRFLVGIVAAAVLIAYIGSFWAVIKVGHFMYLDYNPQQVARGYHFAADPAVNRRLYYFYYPLAKCYGWATNAVFLEEDPLASE